MKSIRQLIDVGAHPAEPVGQRRDPIALLDAQFLRPCHGQLAAVRSERGEHGQLVDDARNLLRRDREFPRLP